MKTSYHISKILKAFFRRLATLSVATTLSSTTLSATYFATGTSLATALAGVGVAQAADIDYDETYTPTGGGTYETQTGVSMTNDIDSNIYVYVDFSVNAKSGQSASGIYAGTVSLDIAGILTVISTNADDVNTKLYGVYANKLLDAVSSDISVSLSGSDKSMSAYGLYLGEWSGCKSLSSNITVSCSGKSGTAYGIYLADKNMGPGVISGDILATADYNAYGIWSNADTANLTFADGASVTATSSTNWGTVNSIATAGGTLLLQTENDSTTAQVAINGDIYVKGTSTGTYNTATFESGIFNVDGNISCSDLTIDYGSTLSVAEGNTILASSGLTINTRGVSGDDSSACLVLADNCTLDVSGTITLDLTGLSSLSNAEIMLLLGDNVTLGEKLTGINIKVDDVTAWTDALDLIYDADGVFDDLTYTLTDGTNSQVLNYDDIAINVFGYDVIATTDWDTDEPYGLKLDGSTASFSYNVEASIDFSTNESTSANNNAAALYVTGDMDSISGDVSVSGTSGGDSTLNQAFGIYNTATINSLSSKVTASNNYGSAIAVYNEGSLTLDGASLSATDSMVSVALDNAAGATITIASNSSLSATGTGTNIALAASGDLTLNATNDATLSMTGDISALGYKLSLSSGNYVLMSDATISAMELTITAGANLSLNGTTTFSFKDLTLDITNYSESDGALLTIASGASVTGSFNLNIVTGDITSIDFNDAVVNGTLSTTAYYFYETVNSDNYYGVVMNSDTAASIDATGLISVLGGSNDNTLIDVTFNTTSASKVDAPEYGIALEIRGSDTIISGNVDVSTSGSTNGFSHIYAVYADSSLNATNLSISGDINVSSDSYAMTYGVWTNASLGTISGSISAYSVGLSYAIYNEAADATLTFGDGASLSASGSATNSYAIYSNGKALTLSTGGNDGNITLTGNIYTSTTADLTLLSGNYSITGASTITAKDMLINADASLTLNGATTFNVSSLTLDVTGHATSDGALLTIASDATVTGLDTITLITGDDTLTNSSLYIDGELTDIRYEFYKTASDSDWYYLQANLVATSVITDSSHFPTTAHSLAGNSSSIFDLTIAADITYSDSSKDLNGSALTVTGAYGSIAGDISMLSTGSSNSSVMSKAYAIYASGADITTISTTIDVESTNSYAYGVYLTGSAVDTISSAIKMELTKPTSTASGCGFGVYIYNNSSVDELSGSISIDASAVSNATVYGVYAASGSDIDTISGSINVEGGSTLYALYLYGNDSTDNGRTVNFTNGATLEATGATGSSESYALYSNQTNLTLTADNDTDVINLTGSISTTSSYDLTLSSGEYRTQSDATITAKDLTIEAGATLTLNKATTFDVSALWLDVTNYASTDNVLLKIASTNITLDSVNVVTGNASIKSYSDYISDNAGIINGTLFYFYETAASESSYLTATTLAESSSVSDAMITLDAGESSSDNLGLTVDFDKDSSNTSWGTAVYTNAANVSIEGNIFVTGDGSSANDTAVAIYLDSSASATISSSVDVSNYNGAAYAIYSEAESITFVDGASLTATNALYSTGAMSLNGAGTVSLNGLVTINGDLSLEGATYDVTGNLTAADLSITTGACLIMDSGTSFTVDSLTLNVTDLANTSTMLDLSSVSSATGLDLITIELSAADYTLWDSNKLDSLISVSDGLLDDSIVTIYVGDVAAEVYGTVIANEPLNSTTALLTTKEESATDLSLNLNAVLDYNSYGGYATALYNTGALAEFSGDITVTTELTSTKDNSYQAHGLYNDGTITELSGNITVSSDKTDAYGLFTAARGTVGTISGNITVTGTKTNYAFYSNGDTDISFADGVTLSSSGGTENYAIYANQALSMSSANSSDAVSFIGDVNIDGDWTLSSGDYSLTGDITAADMLIGSDASLTLTKATNFTVDALWLDATGFEASDAALLTITNGLTGISSLNIITGDKESLDYAGTIVDENDSLDGAFYYFYETADSDDWYGFTTTTAMKDSEALTFTGLLSLGADEQLDAIVDVTFESAGANTTQSGTALQVKGANVSIAGDIDVRMTGDGSMNASLIAVYAANANGAENVTLSGDISVYTAVFAKAYGLYTEVSTGIISGSISAESAHYAYAIYSEAENPTFTFADGASLSAMGTSTHSFALYSAGYAMTLETTTDYAQVSFTGSLAASLPTSSSTKYDITVNSGHYTFTGKSTITADTLLIEQGASMIFNGETTFNVNTMTLNVTDLVNVSTMLDFSANSASVLGLDTINIMLSADDYANWTTDDIDSLISNENNLLEYTSYIIYNADVASQIIANVLADTTVSGSSSLMTFNESVATDSKQILTANVVFSSDYTSATALYNTGTLDDISGAITVTTSVTADTTASSTNNAYGVYNTGSIADVSGGITVDSTYSNSYGLYTASNSTVDSISSDISVTGELSNYAFYSDSAMTVQLADGVSLSASGGTANYAIYSSSDLELVAPNAAITLTGDVVSEAALSFSSGTYNFDNGENTTLISASDLTITSASSLVLGDNTSIAVNSLTLDITSNTSATNLLKLTNDTVMTVADKTITVLVDANTYALFEADTSYALELIYDKDLKNSLWGDDGTYSYIIACDGQADLTVDYDQIAYGFPFIYATTDWSVDNPYAVKLDATTYDGQSYAADMDESICFADQTGELDYSGAAIYNEANLTALTGSIKLTDDTSIGGSESEYNNAYAVYNLGDIASMEASIEITNSIGNAIGIYNEGELTMNVASITASASLISCAIWNNSEATLNFAQDITLSATGGSTANYAVYSESNLSMSSSASVTMQGDLNAGTNSITLKSGKYSFDNSSANTTITAANMSIAAGASLTLSGNTDFAFSDGTLTLYVTDLNTVSLDLNTANTVTGLDSIKVVLTEELFDSWDIDSELSFILDDKELLKDTSYYIYDDDLSGDYIIVDTAFADGNDDMSDDSSSVVVQPNDDIVSGNTQLKDIYSTLDYTVSGKAAALTNTADMSTIKTDIVVDGSRASNAADKGYGIYNSGTIGTIDAAISITGGQTIYAYYTRAADTDITFADGASLSATGGAVSNYAIYAEGDLIISTENSDDQVYFTGDVFAEGDISFNSGIFTIDGDVTGAHVTISDASQVTMTGTVELESLNLQDTQTTVSLNDATVMQLTGDSEASIQGSVNISGKAENNYVSRYEGSYAGDTYITVQSGAEAVLSTSDKLTLMLKAGSTCTLNADSSGIFKLNGINTNSMSMIASDSETSYQLNLNGSVTQSIQLKSASDLSNSIINLSVTSDTMLSGSTLVLTSGAAVNFTDATLNITMIDNSGDSPDLSNLSDTGNALITLSSDAASLFDGVTINAEGDAWSKYFKNFEVIDGVLYADLNQQYYAELVTGAGNDAAGMVLVNEALIAIAPQLTENREANPDLAAAMDAMDGYKASGDSDSASRLAAAIAGAAITSLNSALLSDVERQLGSIRNRTQDGSLALALEGTNFSVWAQAENASSQLDDKSRGYHAGHDYKALGGSMGIDTKLGDQTMMGLAFTAMYGDVDNYVAGKSKGTLDTTYISLYGRHDSGAWTHRFVGSMGLVDASMDRTVSHSTGSYKTKGDTDGTAFGLSYEAAYAIELNEEKTSTISPIVSASLIHSQLDAYTEKGSDATLRVSDQRNTYLTLGIGAQFDHEFGSSVFNRQATLSAQALITADIGNRGVDADVSLTNNPDTSVRITGSDPGVMGLKIGVGFNLPVNEKGDAVFLNINYSIRNELTEGSSTLGYRFNF